MSRHILLISGDLRTFQKNAASYHKNLILPNKAHCIISSWQKTGELGSPIKAGLGNFLFRTLIKITGDEWKAQKALRPFIPLLALSAKFQTINKTPNAQVMWCNEYHEETLPNDNTFRLFDFVLSDEMQETIVALDKKSKLAVKYCCFVNMMPMFYKIWASFREYEERFGYDENDIIIRIRPDLDIRKPILFQETLSEGIDLVVSKPGEEQKNIWERSERLPDQFFWGRAKAMKQASKVILNIEEHLRSLLHVNSISLGGEFLFAEHIRISQFCTLIGGWHKGIIR